MTERQSQQCSGSFDGRPCEEPASPETLGFCARHFDILRRKASGRGALPAINLHTVARAIEVLAAATVLIEFVAKNCQGVFGPGGAGRDHEWIMETMDIGPSWDDLPDSYTPGHRVDWESTRMLVTALVEVQVRVSSGEIRPEDDMRFAVQFAAWSKQLPGWVQRSVAEELLSEGSIK